VIAAVLVLLSDVPASLPPNPPLASASIAFDIDDRAFRMPIPDGYCVPRNPPAATRGEHSNAAGHVLASLAYVQGCGANNEGESIFLKYIRNFDPKAPSREVFLALAAKRMGSTAYIGEQESESFANRVEHRTETTTGRKIDAQIAASHVGHDKLCVYQVRTMTVALAGDAVGTVRMASCTTLINGRVVTIDVASTSGEDGFDTMVRRLHAITASIEPVS
jgi:hypothetical protein